ncbi:26S proteasome regulatory subunit rpn-1 [Aspergillus rambellii]|uniref:Serine/threonine-protein kinase RIO2 n=1 Tax=Aspergillus rambellii TaxID=308745 RepID=A0A0F8VI90_9EURO|nr:26S proteasome regulatory subunit rpn-1 [Aspergillus rambellii]
MAKEGERSAPADKGKGKVDDVKDLVGGKKSKPEEKTQSDEKQKGEAPKEEELSEEDQQLKNELEMLVERLKEPDASLYGPALDAIKNFIKTSTSSMTAVPKPLKFLRPHYDDLAALYDKWSAGTVKDALADMLSVLGMTYGDEEKLETLKYRLLTKSNDLGSWGHEYVRHLALEIGQEYQNRLNAEKDVQDLIDLALSLVPYFLSHNAEADAVDLLSELEIIEEIPRFVDENTYARVCLYMVSMVNLLTYPEDQQFLRTAHEIYVRYKELTKAIVLAIRLNDTDLIKSDLNATTDQSIKKQMAFLVARQQIWLDPSPEDEEDQTFMDCLNNTSIPKHFKSLGKELNILDPKMPEDIYETHLESSRGAGLTNVDSARHNLASAFVNAFANAGFGNDKMMLVDGDKGPWVWKTKDDGMLSTTASMGMLLHQDVEIGLDKIDKYTYASEDQIKAGALLSIGILNSGVRIDSDPALALLSDPDNLEAKNLPMRVASIMGLGLAYAGSNKEELLDVLLPIVEDVSLDMQLSAMAAVSLGLIFVGSSNHQVSEAIATTLMDEERQKHLKDKWTRFMALGLALLYFGRQEEVDVILDILKAVDHPMAKPTSVLASVCAWAGTGTVLKLQELLHICNDVIEESDEKMGDELVQSYAVLGLSLIAMGEEVGQDMILRQFGHLMHYGASNIRKAVPLAMGLISPSNPQMKVYDTLSRYSHDNDNDVAINAIFAMGLCGAGTKNSRLAQLLRQLASYYHRDQNTLFMVRIAQGLLHMGKGTMTLNPFHTDRQVLSRVSAAGLLTVLVSLIDAKQFILAEHHYLLYFLITAMYPRFLVTLDEDLQPLTVNVRVGQAVDVVGQAGRPKTITGWQTQSTPVLLSYGERAELEDEQYIPLSSTLEGLVILRKKMKLDPKAIRYLTAEDFRVLAAVEQGSRNHEVVPTPLIAQIAGLRGGSGVHRAISNLAKTNLIAKVKNAKYDGYRLTYGGLDYLALNAHQKQKCIYSVGNQIGVGKESDIVVVADHQGTQRILKIHRLGRISFRTVKTNRDYLRNRSTGSWMYMSRLAAMKEFAFMKALRENGFSVPEPIAQNRHTIVMSLIDAFPLRQISKVPNPELLYSELMDIIMELARYGLIHGDFNEFNILIKEEEESRAKGKGREGEDDGENIKLTPVLIDFPQMVSIDHANAEMYFDRDVNCIKRYFQRKFHFVSDVPGPFFADAKKQLLQNAGKRLDVEVEASGFSRKMARELEAYMKEVGVDGDKGAANEDGEDSDEDEEEVSGSEDAEEDKDEDQEESGADSKGPSRDALDESAEKLEKLQVSGTS